MLQAVVDLTSKSSKVNNALVQCLTDLVH